MLALRERAAAGAAPLERASGGSAREGNGGQVPASRVPDHLRKQIERALGPDRQITQAARALATPAANLVTQVCWRLVGVNIQQICVLKTTPASRRSIKAEHVRARSLGGAASPRPCPGRSVLALAAGTKIRLTSSARGPCRTAACCTVPSVRSVYWGCPDPEYRALSYERRRLLLRARYRKSGRRSRSPPANQRTEASASTFAASRFQGSR